MLPRLEEAAKAGKFHELALGVLINLGEENKIPLCKIVELNPVYQPIKQSDLFDNLLNILAKKNRFSTKSSEKKVWVDIYSNSDNSQTKNFPVELNLSDNLSNRRVL